MSLMIDLWKKIKEHPIASKIVTTLAATTILSGVGYLVAFLKSGFDMWFCLTILFAIISLTLGIFLYRSHPELIWVPNEGVWKNIRTGNYYCPTCKGDGRKTPLGERENHWYCPGEQCGFWIYRPGKEPKPEPRREIVSHGVRPDWLDNFRR